MISAIYYVLYWVLLKLKNVNASTRKFVKKKLIEIKLIINVVLLSGVQKSDLVIDIIFKFFSNMVYYRILNKLAWAVQ